MSDASCPLLQSGTHFVTHVSIYHELYCTHDKDNHKNKHDIDEPLFKSTCTTDYNGTFSRFVQLMLGHIEGNQMLVDLETVEGQNGTKNLFLAGDRFLPVGSW